MTQDSSTPKDGQAPASKRFSVWAYVPALLLLVMVSGLFVMARIAMDDPGFAVERDYYKKAVSWDALQAQSAENERLGWRVALESTGNIGADGSLDVRLSLTSADETPLLGATLIAEAFPNAAASQVAELKFRELGHGRYTARVPHALPGLWELRVSAAHGSDRYTQTLRVELIGGRDS